MPREGPAGALAAAGLGRWLHLPALGRAVTAARVDWFPDPLPLPLPAQAAWTRNLVTVEIERGSVPAAVTKNMPAGDVGPVICGLADKPEVKVTTSGSHPAAGKIMMAVSGGNYLLGLLSRTAGSTSMPLRVAGSPAPGSRSPSKVRSPRSNRDGSLMPGRLRPPFGDGWQLAARRCPRATG